MSVKGTFFTGHQSRPICPAIWPAFHTPFFAGTLAASHVNLSRRRIEWKPAKSDGSEYLEDKGQGWRVVTSYFPDGAGADPEEKYETIVFGRPWDCVYTRTRTRLHAEATHAYVTLAVQRAWFRRFVLAIAFELMNRATRAPWARGRGLPPLAEDAAEELAEQ